MPIYTTLAANSVGYIIKDSGAKVFFLETIKCYERIKEIFAECETLEKIVFFYADKTENIESAMSLEDLEKAAQN